MCRRLPGVLAVLVALAVPGPAVAATDPNEPVFNGGCLFSHRGPDDPIVSPGQPGAAHSHDFFGNVSTSSASTGETLAVAGTTCQRPQERAAYWVPTLSVNGAAVEPTRMQVYYRGSTTSDRTAIRPHPPGLKVIAGDARATAPQPRSVVAWNCGDGRPSTATVPTCRAGQELRAVIQFPSCWDGASRDSADHRSHMAYPMRAACPASHPVAVPQLLLSIHYPTTGGPGVTLSSGAPHTMHADFFNAWDQGELERLVAACINAAGNAGRPPCIPGDRPETFLLATGGGRVVYGTDATLSGATPSRPGSAVSLEQAAAAGWTPLAQLDVGPTGWFSHTVTARRNTRFRAVDAAGRIAEFQLKVMPRIDVRLAGARQSSGVYRTRPGRRLAVYARTTPMKRRVVLVVERQVRGAYGRVLRRTLRTRRGRAATSFELEPAGTYRLAVWSVSDRLNARGSSEPLTLAVR